MQLSIQNVHQYNLHTGEYHHQSACLEQVTWVSHDYHMITSLYLYVGLCQSDHLCLQLCYMQVLQFEPLVGTLQGKGRQMRGEVM